MNAKLLLNIKTNYVAYKNELKYLQSFTKTNQSFFFKKLFYNLVFLKVLF